MSNHLHDGIYRPLGNAPDVLRDFHKLLAKCMNCAARPLGELLHTSEQVCVVRCETPRRRHQEARLHRDQSGRRRPRRACRGLARRQRLSRADDGRAAARDATQALLRRGRRHACGGRALPHVPPELGDRETLLAEVRAGVAAVEAEAARASRAHWQARPRPLRGPAPVVARFTDEPRAAPEASPDDRCAQVCGSGSRRSSASVSLSPPIAKPERRLLAGTPIPFPYGTYALRRFLASSWPPLPKIWTDRFAAFARAKRHAPSRRGVTRPFGSVRGRIQMRNATIAVTCRSRNPGGVAAGRHHGYDKATLVAAVHRHRRTRRRGRGCAAARPSRPSTWRLSAWPRSCQTSSVHCARPVAPSGWPFESRPPDGLVTNLPP